jgi:hypothetical protein
MLRKSNHTDGGLIMSYLAKTPRAWAGCCAVGVTYSAALPIFCYEYDFLIILSRYAQTFF